MARSVNAGAKPFGVLADASGPLARYIPVMSNAFVFVLDEASVRRAAVEGVPETVIAAIYLLHERSVGEVAAKLKPDELEHVIRLVGRCPSCYPPGTLDALKTKRMASLTPTAARLLPSARPKKGLLLIRAPNTGGHSRAQRLRKDERRKGPNAAPKRTGFRRATGRESSGKAAKSGIAGTAAETARRRLLVQDLMGAGLSVAHDMRA